MKEASQIPSRYPLELTNLYYEKNYSVDLNCQDLQLKY